MQIQNVEVHPQMEELKKMAVAKILELSEQKNVLVFGGDDLREELEKSGKKIIWVKDVFTA